MFFDLPQPYQLSFQDPASPIMEGIIYFHNWILFWLIVITIFVSYFIVTIIVKFQSNLRITKRENTLLEIIWTITPAFILITIALPSFKLLYLMDEIIDPSITIKTIGHQWYWEYEYTDYNNPIKSDSYMIPTDDLSVGDSRLLEVDEQLILPTDTSIRVITTATDVLHSWAIPSLGVKLDAVPGRLNQTGLYIKRNGIYYGQCSEICGVQHGFMPIVIKSVDTNEYIQWLTAK